MSAEHKIMALDNPCATCPYRKDTPAGIWNRSEYDKLPAWDGTEMHEMNTRLFLCHSANLAGNKAVCRGWLEVHCENKGVRLNLINGRITSNGIPTKVPLHNSGADARRAGLRGIKKPSTKAHEAINKLDRVRRAKGSGGKPRTRPPSCAKKGTLMSSNEHPDMSGSGCDDGYWSDDEVENKVSTAFVCGAQQMREMLARFVEQGGSDLEKRIATSIRANWTPGWGDDPGEPADVHNAIDAALP